jgi:sterol desaturase/sphingolipid hydroxylase (fatty acid hydroxylase superfamily)
MGAPASAALPPTPRSPLAAAAIVAALLLGLPAFLRPHWDAWVLDGFAGGEARVLFTYGPAAVAAAITLLGNAFWLVV